MGWWTQIMHEAARVAKRLGREEQAVSRAGAAALNAERAVGLTTVPAAQAAAEALERAQGHISAARRALDEAAAAARQAAPAARGRIRSTSALYVVRGTVPESVPTWSYIHDVSTGRTSFIGPKGERILISTPSRVAELAPGVYDSARFWGGRQ